MTIKVECDRNFFLVGTKINVLSVGQTVLGYQVSYFYTVFQFGKSSYPLNLAVDTNLYGLPGYGSHCLMSLDVLDIEILTTRISLKFDYNNLNIQDLIG